MPLFLLSISSSLSLQSYPGRSYNDLMQYPVFPWIIADYDSQDLDLYSASTFRDLSKPMGALHPDRMEQYKKRHREWDDPTGETPAYHYGTHYSSAMIVASYLVRMEPFTQVRRMMECDVRAQKESAHRNNRGWEIENKSLACFTFHFNLQLLI